MALSPDFVHRRLRAAARGERWSRVGRSVVSGAAASLAGLVVFLLVDTRFHAGAAVRWTGFLCVVAPLLAGAAGALAAWRRRLPELAIARRVEQACPDAGNSLVSALQFDRDLPPGRGLRAAVFQELTDPFPRVDWGTVFDLPLLARLGLALLGAALAVFLWAAVRPAAFANSVSRVLLPASRIAPLTRTRLEVLRPGNASVTHGSALEVAAFFSGEIPRAAWVRYREPGGGWQRALMDREVGAPSFSFRWPDVRQPLEYSLEAGDLETPVYGVSVRARTAVKGRRAEIRPPAYTGLPAATASNFQSLDGVVPGSTVTFTLDFNNPVESVALSGDEADRTRTERLGDARWSVATAVRSSGTMALTFRDRLDEEGKEALPIRVSDDQPPKISVAEPVEGRELVMAAPGTLAVRFTASDDYGLGRVGLYCATAEKPDGQLVQEWPEAEGRKSFAGTAEIAVARFARPGDQQVTFYVAARDKNDVAPTPGFTLSRPLRVTLASADTLRQRSMESTAQLEQGLRDLIKLQRLNLDSTRAALAAPETPPGTLVETVARQTAVGALAASLAALSEGTAPEVRGTLQSLARGEMPAAVQALRDAVAATGTARPPLLGTAARLETVILARLRGAPEQADRESRRVETQNLIAGVDGLLRDQKAIQRETGAPGAGEAAGTLSERQDALAEQSAKVCKEVQTGAGNAAVGDAVLRAGLAKIAALFGECKIYEEMLRAADALGSRALPKALATQAGITANLQRMVDILSRWQVAQAGARSDEMRKAAEAMKAKLAQLAELQRSVVEKSRELARKDQFSRDDVNTAEGIARTKDAMAKSVEGMLTDANVFPDMIISNELKAQLSSIFEDVKQDDLDAIAKGKLRPQDVPVQKEDSLMASIEKTKKIPEDMEMFLPKTSNTANNLDENFDNTEIPKLDNLPLPDELTDIIGTLQKEQEDLAAKVQGAASNQILKAMQQGGPIMDGPQSGYSAQGKSGNQKPMDFEQGGRSAGGREGESNGEMVGKMADDLEGRAAKVRRTSDPMQSGNVEDPGDKLANAKATGGGKASGFSNREGMDGDAPLRGARAPHQAAADALAAAQAQLAQKTSQKAAQASLLFLRSDRLQTVAGLMQESQSALGEGRVADFQGLHQRIMAELHGAQGDLTGAKVIGLAAGDAARAEDKTSLGGGEGDAPTAYKDRVADYYRSLANGP